MKAEAMWDLLRAQGQVRSDDEALVAPGRPGLTYQGLSALADRVVATLHAHDLGRGHRVALAMPNGPEMLAAFVTIACGATVAPLHPGSTPAELDAAFGDQRIDALVVYGEAGEAARKVALERGLLVLDVSVDPADPAGVFSLTARRRRAASSARLGPAASTDIALLLTTSGSTAKAKVVPSSHAELLAGAKLTADALGLTDSDRYLCIMPMHHTHALVTSMAALLTGGCVIAAPPFEADDFFRCLDLYQPTWYSAAPALHQAILARADAFPAVVEQSRLRVIRSSSASLPPVALAELEDVFRAPVVEGYGMTETCLYATNNPLPPAPRKVGSVGVACGIDLAVFDPTGHQVAAGERGEIVLRGANIMRAYEHDPEANAAAFVNGWFRTGDQGYLDADGYLYLTGRLHDRINRGGEKISPGAIEALMLAHPEVARAVVFAVPHPSLGEDVAAAVVLRDASQSSALDLRRYVATRLTAHKVPSQILIVDEIPTSPTGKIQRHRLAQTFVDQLKAEFVEPRNHVELGLADVWQEVLGLSSISVNDNFFMLGGDSIKAMQVVNRLRGELHADLSIRDLFMAPTIAALAQSLCADTPASELVEPTTALPVCATQVTAASSVQPAAVAPVIEPPVGAKGSASPRDDAQPRRAMQLSVFFFSAQDSAADGDKYRLFIDGVRYADRHGFTAVFTPERHFHPFGGLYPNPSILGAAAAMVTERIQIRAGSVVVPFQDPLRVAEEWSVIDNLSHGRVGIACASGWHVNDFVLAPEHYERRRDVMIERIEMIQRLWRGEPLMRPNGAGKLTEVRIYPQPLQPSLPIWLAAHSDATFIKAGELNAHILTALWDTHPDQLARRIALYRKARARHGFDPAAGTVTLMLHTYVGSTMADVEQQVIPAYETYLRVNLGLQDDRMSGIDDAVSRSDQDNRFIIAQATEELFRDRGLVGTPEVCLDKIARYQRLGIDELACLIDFGIPTNTVLEGMERLGSVLRTVSAPDTQGPRPETRAGVSA